MESTLKAIAAGFAILGGLYAFWKLIREAVFLFFEKSSYNLNAGHHLVKSIEKEFGRDAGIVIKSLIQQQSKDHKTSGLRLEKIESHAGLGIYACNAEGACTFANPALAELFEMERS